MPRHGLGQCLRSALAEQTDPSLCGDQFCLLGAEVLRHLDGFRMPCIPHIRKGNRVGGVQKQLMVHCSTLPSSK